MPVAARFRRVTPVALALTLALGAFVATQAQSPSDAVRAAFTKYEYMVPMRDGVKLFTSVYVPKDASTTYPILLTRTPYSVAPYGVANYRDSLGPAPTGYLDEGYIFVYQDVRGTMMSEGVFVNMRPHLPVKAGQTAIDESTDTYDTIDWLVTHIPNNNGRVGQYGISYPGFYSAAGMIDAHPALKAVSPQAPIADWFAGDDFHHNGALFLPHAFNFFSSFGHPRPAPTTKWGPRFEHGTEDGYRFFLDAGPMPAFDTRYLKGGIAFWNEMLAHEQYDEFWKSRNLRPHLKNIAPAVMTVGGWFDAENLYGALQVYRATETQGAKNQNILVMGPWFHGGWARGEGSSLGDVRFDSKTSEYYRDRIERPFFRYHLKGTGQMTLPEATVFETGTNVWRSHDTWPPKGATPTAMYLAASGQLTTTAPEATRAFDEFVSDPAKPVPVVPYIALGMTREYMVDDQRHASTRPDVLVYQTPVLDADTTIAGPIDVELLVSTSSTDADWIVKVIDVYPDDFPNPSPNPRDLKMGGFQQMLRGDVMRGKFRNSLEKPEAFVPNQATTVRFTMNDVYHTFRRGHRMMVQVQSTWFPLVNRNPQTFTNINTAGAGAYVKATHRVYREGDKGSKIIVRRM